jgi:DNA polymerase-1
VTTIRQYLATLPRRKQVVRDVLLPLEVGTRDGTMVAMYERLAPGSDGRIHTGLGVGTVSGRLSSSETIVEESSTNLQNQANKIATLDPLYHTRDVMCADPGFRLIALDYASAEAILALAYANDWEWVDRLLSGESMHAHHVKEFFGVRTPLAQVKKQHKEMYTTAKNITFASLYSASARTVAVTFNKDYPVHGQRITEKEVIRIQKILFQLHPLQAWWEEVGSTIRRSGGVVRNCFGQRRVLRDPDEHNRLKDALSQLPQSTVATLMNRAIWQVHEEVDRQGEIELLHQNHDEMDLQALPEYVDEALSRCAGIMQSPLTINGRTFAVPVEAKIGEVGGSWGMMTGVAIP